jgi:hypothetical protein
MKFSSHNRDMVTSRFPLAITLRLPTIDWSRETGAKPDSPTLSKLQATAVMARSNCDQRRGNIW